MCFTMSEKEAGASVTCLMLAQQYQKMALQDAHNSQQPSAQQPVAAQGSHQAVQ